MGPTRFDASLKHIAVADHKTAVIKAANSPMNGIIYLFVYRDKIKKVPHALQQTKLIAAGKFAGLGN